MSISGQSPERQQRTILTGTATDSLTKQPLREVYARLNRDGEHKTAVSDEHGQFTIPALKPGQYTLKG